jgi:hypothetical protein
MTMWLAKLFAALVTASIASGAAQAAQNLRNENSVRQAVEMCTEDPEDGQKLGGGAAGSPQSSATNQGPSLPHQILNAVQNFVSSPTTKKAAGFTLFGLSGGWLVVVLVAGSPVGA